MNDTNKRETENTKTANNTKRATFRTVAMSVLAAMFGVQSDKNRTRDFQHGKAIHYILGGVLFVVLFVVSILSLVNLIIK